jgi:NADH dehydrogenase [ubiquinone] 1 alpha subcomplex assembly factor 5
MSDSSASHPFDRTLHARRRQRAAENFINHDFLVARARDEISDRLASINRSFPLTLDLGVGLGPHAKIGSVISGDVAPAMLTDPQNPRLVLDEEMLPFAPASFDLIVSALQLHWVNDLPGALIQLRRALKPDGLFIGALLGGDTLTELRQALTAAEIEIEGGVSPHVSPFADLRDMGSLLQRAGFAMPVADTDRVNVRYTDMFRLLAELRGMGETNVLNERRRAPLHRATLLRAAEIYQQTFGLSDGRIPATFEIFYVTGWAPHESQPKPLKPGSATHRLADALGAEERPAGEKAPHN